MKIVLKTYQQDALQETRTLQVHVW